MLEHEIVELASHIHAATCRWLCMVAEFDRREGWARWGCRSCAHWVSWQCGVSPVAAREHVRVALRLQELPLIRAAFADGRLSYSKARALTRVPNVDREQDLLDLARHATAAQLERLVRAHRGAVAVELAARGERPQRSLSWTYDDDGSLLLRGRLPAEEGALVVAALEAARDRLRDSRDDHASAEAPATGEERADALALIADSFLATGPAERSSGDRFQVVVHVDADTLRGDQRGDRCELGTEQPVAAETARRLACDAAIVPLIERAGQPLSVGRKTRSVPPALRRALTARDRGCRFPGCDARRFADAHHIEHWARGGATSLRNLVLLCRHHHRLLHEGGYTVGSRAGGELVFRRPDGRRIAGCPSPPGARATALRSRLRGIAPDACASLSAGAPLDLDLGVQAMLAFAPPGPAEPPGI